MRSLSVLASLLAVTFGFVGAAHAEANFRLRILNRDQPNKPLVVDIAARLANNFTKESNVGWYAFMQLTPTWAQGYIGPKWDVTPWLNLYGALGVQQQGTKGWLDQMNVGFDVTLPNKLGSVWLDTEFDHRFLKTGLDDAFWYEAAVMGNVAPGVSVGVHARRFYGSGPHIDFKPKADGNVKLFLSWLPFNQEYWNSSSIPTVAWLRGNAGVKFYL